MLKKKCYSYKRIFLIKRIVFFFLFFIRSQSEAQDFKSSSFQSIVIPANARQMALGGKNISSIDKDPSMFLSNPSALSKEMDNYMSFSYLPYFAQTNFLSATYIKDFGNAGSWGAGINYLNYGTFEGYDLNGEYTGNFKASEYSLIISNAHFKNNFSFGITAKFAGAFIAGYSSSAFLFDVGGMFIHPDKDLRIGMAIKNVGFKIKSFTPSSSFIMPFDAQLGGSFKPEHMPLRFSLTLHSLNKFKLLYGSNGEDNVGAGEQILSHVVVGTEVLISKNINLRVGYDYLRRQELKNNKAGLAGVSLGAMVRIRGFELAFGRGFYNQAGGQNCISLNIDLNKFIKQK